MRITAAILLGRENISAGVPYTLRLMTATAAADESVKTRRREQTDSYNEFGMGATMPEGFTELDRISVLRDP